MAQHRIPVLEVFAWQQPVISILNTPPGSPVAGDRYIIGTSPIGDWAGNANQIAWRDSTQWHYDVPAQGWHAHNLDNTKDYLFNGTNWVDATGGGDFIESIVSSTDNNVPQWDGITGTKLKDGLSVQTTVRASGSAADTALATEKAVRDAIDGIIGATDAMVFKGGIDCSGNPDYPAADAGHTYKVTVAGKIGGASGPNVEVADTLVCTVDTTASGNHATVGANWIILQVNIDGAVTYTGAAVTSDHLVAFDGTSGRIIKSSGILGSSVSGHIGDSSIHFTEANISHLNISNIGTNSHSTIDTHIGTAAIHRNMAYSASLKAIIYTE